MGLLHSGVVENVARRCGTGHCTGLLQSTLREDVTGGCCTEHCTAHCIALCKGMLHRAMPLAGCGTGVLHRASHGDVLAQGVAWGSGMGKLRGALHGSIAQHCVGTLHRAGKRGSPTTDPIPNPAPAQPQVRIIPTETGNARVPVRLSCHIWGFYPPEVTVIWLHNGDIVEPDDYNPISAIPNGDWTYHTQVSLLVAPVAGDTYTCSVQHVTILVAVATVLMVLGLGLFLTGVYRYKARPPAPGEGLGRAG
uniref:Ig-like domain-containing protein n=1 Tax=Anas platyrhynchos platyrhynchos TaxID=8840 RepID=A0A493T1G3_ANAPP